MARLKTLKPTLKTLPPRLVSVTAFDAVIMELE